MNRISVPPRGSDRESVFSLLADAVLVSVCAAIALIAIVPHVIHWLITRIPGLRSYDNDIGFCLVWIAIFFILFFVHLVQKFF